MNSQVYKLFSFDLMKFFMELVKTKWLAMLTPVLQYICSGESRSTELRQNMYLRLCIYNLLGAIQSV